jgi:polyferredoxin
MKEKKGKKTNEGKTCKKCGIDIGGQAYYIIQLDCIYDGKSLSACDRIVVCSECYSKLTSWLNISK